MPEVADLERRRLVGGPARLRGADRPGASTCGRRARPRLERRLEDHPRAAQVGGEDGVAVGGAQRGPAGDVEDAVDAVHRPADRAAVGDVAGRALELEPSRWREVGAAPGEQAELVARAGERPGEMRAEEAARAGDQCLAPSGCILERRLRSVRQLIRKPRWARTPRTAVVTDTTAYLPDELVAEHGIHRVSLYVTLDGDQRRESEIDAAEYDDFYERLRRSDEGATTSQPSVGDFVALYEPLLAEGRDIVSIHISAGISGTYESALQAREQLIESGAGGERIHVWDSRTGCGGQGMMALVAARAAAAGHPAPRRWPRSSDARESLKMWFAIDTLEYLRKGGRIGAAQAWLGSALQIKPILTLEEEITPVERVRTRRRAFERMVEFARERQARRRRRLGRPAHPRPRHGQAAGRRVPSGLRQRPGLRLRDRAGDRRPRRPRPARRRRDPHRAAARLRR